MRNSVLTLLAGLVAMPLVGCTDGSNSGGTPDRQPYRDDWRQVAEVAFVHTDFAVDPPAPLITDITIGGKEFNNNFANRGDVIVNFDGPADKILIEFRKFTTNTSDEAAQKDFDAMSLWAYNQGIGSPVKPSAELMDASCIDNGWRPGCGVRVYYDGQTQLGRAGTDIRVTLPSDYRRSVKINTEDADEDGDYLNRGNVCVNGTNGAVDIAMQSGEAFVIISDEATPAPACGAPPNTKSNPSSQVVTCNELETEGVNTAWSTDCFCAMTGEYGVVKVVSDESASTDINIDVPAGLWAAITAENLGDDPELCKATVELPGYIKDESVGNEFDWESKGSVNAPSDAVTPGAGYNIQARSGQCSSVLSTEDPSDFVGVNNGVMQEAVVRGNISVATNKWRGMSCEDLLP